MFGGGRDAHAVRAIGVSKVADGDDAKGETVPAIGAVFKELDEAPDRDVAQLFPKNGRPDLLGPQLGDSEAKGKGKARDAKREPEGRMPDHDKKPERGQRAPPL
jgi:hypothetical protein